MSAWTDKLVADMQAEHKRQAALLMEVKRTGRMAHVDTICTALAAVGFDPEVSCIYGDALFLYVTVFHQFGVRAIGVSVAKQAIARTGLPYRETRHGFDLKVYDTNGSRVATVQIYMDPRPTSVEAITIEPITGESPCAD